MTIVFTRKPIKHCKSFKNRKLLKILFYGTHSYSSYKPKPDKAEALKELTKTHVERLKVEGLVTARAPVIMETADGTPIEVFEWLSAEAITKAHSNPAVHQMWAEYAAVCDYVTLNSLSEARQFFYMNPSSPLKNRVQSIDVLRRIIFICFL
jgi:hypothetical protein